MNKKGINVNMLLNYLLLTFIMVCSIFRYKTIYLESSNILEVSLSNFLYPFTFLFIILIYKNQNFKEAHKTIIKTAITFILFLVLISILNTIPGNYYATETDLALKQVLTPNYFVVNDLLIYYPNILNVLSFTLLYYFSHVLVLILYEAIEPYAFKTLAFALAMFIPFTLDTIVFTAINDMAMNVEINKLVIDLTSNFVIVIIFTIITSLLFFIINKISEKNKIKSL